MKRPAPARYFLASVLLLSALVSLFAVSSTRRTRQELLRQLEERGLALAEAVEVASRSAIRGNALMEEMIEQRLLDNARLVDRLLLARPLDPGILAELREVNRLRRVDLLDREGRPWVPPRPFPGMMMGPRMGPPMMAPPRDPPRGPQIPERHREMMRFFWGHRWGRPADDAGTDGGGPAPIRDRKFWEGTLFGVAIGARSFPGIIAVHADAAFVLDFRKEIGVERQIEELGRQSGVASVALLGPDLAVLAHSDTREVGRREADGFLARALAEPQPLRRLVPRPDGGEVLEVVRPVVLDGARRGLLRIALSTEPLRRAWRGDLQAAVVLGLAVLLAGGLGLGAIFYLQGRHLAEVRTLEAAVEQRERLAQLGNLAAIVGHEIRNPLNAVSMGLQRLGVEWEPTADRSGYSRVVQLMREEVTRLDAIVEEFLSLARPLSLAPVPVSPQPLLAEVAALVEAEAGARGVRLVLEAPSGLPTTRLDRDRVKQVLLNLVKNGLEAMPAGGTLTLGGSASATTLTLTVADTGAGVPPDVLPRIFEPYVTTKAKGTGLGLAIARRIVEAHGGGLAAASPPGAGSRFTVTLPLAGPPAATGGAGAGSAGD